MLLISRTTGIRSLPRSASPNVKGSTFDSGLNSAILRYAGAKEQDPETQSTVTQRLVETDLHPLTPAPVPGVPAPGEADITLRLELNFVRILTSCFRRSLTLDV